MGYLGLHRVQEFDLMLFLAYYLFIWTARGWFHLHPLTEEYHVSLTEHCSIFWLGVASIFVNVIPKYLKRTGAQRHLNDRTDKKFLTRNYIRLLFHILSGMVGFIFIGLVLWNVEAGTPNWSLSTIKIVSIIAEFVHEVTIIIMIRNSDGIQILRTNNAFFAVVKAYYCTQIYDATSINEAAPYLSGVFMYLSGFMATRLYGASLAILGLASGWTMKSMSENWYSTGMFIAHVLIINRTGAMPVTNALFPFFAYHFRHELWTKSNGYRLQTFCVGLIPFAIFVGAHFMPAAQRHSFLTSNIHAVIHILLGGYCAFFAGPYFKREPVLGVDYEKTDAELMAEPTESEKLEMELNEAAGWNRLSFYHSWQTLKTHQATNEFDNFKLPTVITAKNIPDLDLGSLAKELEKELASIESA